VRQNHSVVSLTVVAAVGVTHEGEGTVCFDVGASEEEALWREYLRSLVKRGLKGVQLVISGAHEGLKTVVNIVFSGPDAKIPRW
jgi:transposase-like protein